MNENKFSLIISTNKGQFTVKMGAGSIEYFNIKNNLKVMEEEIPETISTFIERNQKSLKETCESLQSFVDDMAADYPEDPTMGSGFNTSLVLRLDQKGAIRPHIEFYDRQGNGAKHATGALAGGLWALAGASKPVSPPRIEWSSGDKTNIQFNAFTDIKLALEQRQANRTPATGTMLG